MFVAFYLLDLIAFDNNVLIAFDLFAFVSFYDQVTVVSDKFAPVILDSNILILLVMNEYLFLTFLFLA
ncbi:MAG TPA: hypothetical protein DDW24_00595, partial [Blastocatellia bacterium]|nr:hypothetical protein [Blastocatellia bacterium]